MKNELHAVFTVVNGRISKTPLWGDLWQLKEIIDNYGSVNEFLKGIRKETKKKVILRKQIWRTIK